MDLRGAVCVCILVHKGYKLQSLRIAFLGSVNSGNLSNVFDRVELRLSTEVLLKVGDPTNDLTGVMPSLPGALPALLGAVAWPGLENKILKFRSTN